MDNNVSLIDAIGYLSRAIQDGKVVYQVGESLDMCGLDIQSDGEGGFLVKHTIWSETEGKQDRELIFTSDGQVVWNGQEDPEFFDNLKEEIYGLKKVCEKRSLSKEKEPRY